MKLGAIKMLQTHSCDLQTQTTLWSIEFAGNVADIFPKYKSVCNRLHAYHLVCLAYLDLGSFFSSTNLTKASFLWALFTISFFLMNPVSASEMSKYFSQ